MRYMRLIKIGSIVGLCSEVRADQEACFVVPWHTAQTVSAFLGLLACSLGQEHGLSLRWVHVEQR